MTAITTRFGAILALAVSLALPAYAAQPATSVRPKTAASAAATRAAATGAAARKPAVTRSATAQYNPKEVGIDKVQGAASLSAPGNRSTLSSKNEVSIETMEVRKAPGSTTTQGARADDGKNGKYANQEVSH